MNTIGLLDWALLLSYFFVGLIVIVFFYKNSTLISKNLLLKFYLIKTLGAIFFSYIFLYYFEVGDTFLYFQGGNELVTVFLKNPLNFFHLFFSGADHFTPDIQHYADRIPYSKTHEEWFMVKISFLFSIFSFQSFLVINFFLSILSLTGIIQIVKVVKEIVKLRSENILFLALILPSVFIWTSGLLKDTIAFTCFCYIIYLLHKYLKNNTLSAPHLILILLSFWIVFNLKSYLAVSLIPVVLFGIYQQKKMLIRSRLIRSAFMPLLFLAVIFASVQLMTNIAETTEKYKLSKIEDRVVGFQSWHETLGGSYYDLGEVEFTATGVVKKIPESLIVTFFRPFIWEVRSASLLLAGLESFIITLLVLISIYRITRIKALYREIKSSPILLSLLIFALIFGFIVGFTSYNFGALARYKVPATICLMVVLIKCLTYKKVRTT